MKRLRSITLHGLANRDKGKINTQSTHRLMINLLVTEKEGNSHSISFTVHKKQKQKKKSQLLPAHFCEFNFFLLKKKKT